MSLQHVIEAARAAVAGRADNPVHLDQVGGVVMHPEVVKVSKISVRDDEDLKDSFKVAASTSSDMRAYLLASLQWAG